MHTNEIKLYKVVGILFSIFTLFGISYAVFSAILTGVENNATVTITSGDLELTYTDGPEVIAPTDIAPGWSATKTFSVKNTGEYLGAYNVNFSEVTNTFVNTGDLVYSLTSTNGGGFKTQTAIPTSDSTILTNITVAKGVTQTYTLTVSYINAEHNQIDDLNKTFGFTINITSGLVALK